MSVSTSQVSAPTTLWSPDDALSPRVRRLRDDYWDFYNRDYTNEVRAFTTGAPWDQVYSSWNWTVFRIVFAFAERSTLASFIAIIILQITSTIIN